jgi:SAM-dependent methyltransferase
MTCMPESGLADTEDGVQTWRPNVARMFDYYLGGKDNFAADRDAAQQVLAVAPDVPLAARENRGFLIRALHFIAQRAHTEQFVDIGPGLPTGINVHHIAHRFHPGARVVYVDNDPVVVSHGRALLARQSPPVAVIEGDLREPARILAHPQLRELIDLREPVALCLTLVLHFLPDADRPHELVAELLGRLAPGSYLVLSHVTGDGKDPWVRDQITDIYDRASAPLVMRSRDQVARFFAGCAMVPPGLVYLTQWHRHGDTALLGSGGARWAYGGIGVKQPRCTPASHHPGQAISALPVLAPAVGVPPRAGRRPFLRHPAFYPTRDNEPRGYEDLVGWPTGSRGCAASPSPVSPSATAT